MQGLLPLQGHVIKTRADIPKLQKAVEEASRKDENAASVADKVMRAELQDESKV